MRTSNSSTKANQLLVIIPDLETGGGERVTRQLIDALGVLGYRIRLIADVPDHICLQLPLHSHRTLHWKKKIKRLVIIALELLRASDDTTVIAVLTGPIIGVGVLNYVFGRRVVAYEHSDLEQLYLSGSGFKYRLRLSALQLACRSLSKVAVVSEYLQTRLPNILGCKAEIVTVVRNPVQPFYQKLCCSVDFNSKSPLTAYIIGRNANEKRHVAAITLLASTGLVENIILVCRNGESLRQQLSKRANEKLCILDDLTEITYFNHQHSFLFSYSAVESYSLVIAEWLASQLPIITVDNEPMKRLWSQWRGVYFVQEQSQIGELEASLSQITLQKDTDKRQVFKPVSSHNAAKDFEARMLR